MQVCCKMSPVCQTASTLISESSTCLTSGLIWVWRSRLWLHWWYQTTRWLVGSMISSSVTTPERWLAWNIWAAGSTYHNDVIFPEYTNNTQSVKPQLYSQPTNIWWENLEEHTTHKWVTSWEQLNKDTRHSTVNTHRVLNWVELSWAVSHASRVHWPHNAERAHNGI